jgi:CBS domain-containing protein
MKILEIMTSDPACCSPDATLRDVSRMMVEYDCGQIPVCNEKDEIIGVITDRDIVCRAVAEGMDMSTTRVSECMTTSPITVTADTKLEDAINLMEKNMIRRLPVMSENGTLCGMLSQADIACKGNQDLLAEVVQEVSQPTEHASLIKEI